MSVTAAREALRLTASLGLSKRVAQLYGNLALAYGEAGAHEDSSAAFLRFTSELEERSLIERLVVAKRSRAMSRVRSAQAEGETNLDPALRDLAEARAVVESGGYDAPNPPWRVDRTVPNASRGPLGLWLETEREVNLYWAERAHLLQGDFEIAAAIHRARLELLESETDDASKASLNGIRVHLGALVSAARGQCRAERSAECGEHFTRAFGLLERWRDDGAFGADRSSLVLDESRLQAVFLETLAGVSSATREALLLGAPALALRVQETGRLSDQLENGLPESARGLIDLNFDETTPGLLRYVRTASRSADLEGSGELAGLLPLARLGYAQALYDLGAGSGGSVAPAAPGQSEIESMLATLDQELGRRRQLASSFVRAARLASRLMGRDAARLQVAALEAAAHALAVSDGVAPKLARAHVGRLRGVESELSSGLGTDPKARETALSRLRESASLLRGDAQQAMRLIFARSASVALSSGEMASAFELVDRELLSVSTGGRNARHARPAFSEERSFVARYRALLGTLEHEERSSVGASTGSDATQFDPIESLVTLRDTPISEALSLRLFGESGADFVRDALGPDQALLTFASVGGLIQVFFVDGSTTTASPFVHVATELPLASARSAVGAIRGALLAGAPVPPAMVELLDRHLCAPLASRVRDKTTLLLADQVLGEPLPAWVVPALSDKAVAHVSAPSAVLAGRSALVVGESADILIEAVPRDAPMLQSAALTLTAREALGFRDLEERRRGERSATLAPGEARRVDARAVVDRIAGSTSRIVVVDAAFRPSERVPERGVIELGGSFGHALSDLDAQRSSITLGDLDLPAAVWVFGQAELSALPAAGHSPTQALDLAAASAGTASLVLMPSVLDRAVRLRIVERFAAALDERGAAGALQLAAQPELAQHPSAALVTLLGAVGLDPKGARALAESRVGAVTDRIKKAARAGEPRGGAEWAKRLVRLQRFIGAKDEIEKAHRTAVGLLLQAGDYAEAAETQKAWIERPDSGEDASKVAINWLLLGRIYSLARDYETAELVLTRALEMLGETKKPAYLAEALSERASNRTRALRFIEAAADYEAAIAVFEGAGAYDKVTVPAAALDLLRTLAQLYLNQLSEPEKARAQYQRFLKHTGREDDRVATTLSLAQVARKLGEFDRASHLAEQARQGAAALKRTDLELEALTEATNVSWYQGDYARGHRQCQEGLVLAETNLKRAMADKSKKTRRELRGLVYTLSVCGLLHMSTRDFEKAKSALERAAGLARRNDLPAEEASQYNNLGRVYLEFGRLDRAKEAFLRAKALDERLSDRFGLGYDFRNLGTALFLQGQLPEAKLALERALELSTSVNDPNNVLRSTFALAELARAESRDEDARGLYESARVLAQRLSAKDLSWQIHRARGLLELRAGRRAEAEAELRQSVALVRSLTGRSSGTSDTGLHRYQPFDDLILLLLDDGRAREAFELAELARALAETEALDDRRLGFSPAESAALVALRHSRSATVAQAAHRTLSETRARIADLLAPQSSSNRGATVPADARVVSYRITERELVLFVQSGAELVARRTPIEARQLRAQVAALMEGLRDRSEVRGAVAGLSAALLAPITEDLKEARRVVFVPHGPLRYLPFAALLDPTSEGGLLPLVDHFVIAGALDSSSAIAWLNREAPWPRSSPLVGLSAGSPGERNGLVPLLFSAKEVELIKEEFPRAHILREGQATRAALVSALETPRSVVHFSGHAQLDDRDPLGGRLVASDGSLSLFEVMKLRLENPMVVLSACETALAARADLAGNLAGAEDWLSTAQAFQLAGAELVLASTFRVSDLAAALVMKRFYRALRNLEPAEALQAAQKTARHYEPHPAWWSTFTLMVR